jgi:hypothetical protein
MIDLESTHRKELEKLRELHIHERLAICWLKEIFGEKDESFEGSRRAGVRIDKGVRIGTILGEQDSIVTLEGVAGESSIATSEDVESYQGNGTVLHSYTTPRKKYFHSKTKGTSLGSPPPSVPSTNRVNYTPNPTTISIVSHRYNIIGSNYSSRRSGASDSSLVQPGP